MNLLTTNFAAVQSLFFNSDIPALPHVALAHGVMLMAWALVLCAFAAWLGQGLKPSLRWTAAGLIGAWSLLPGSMSPAYWLGLAFQAPSVMSTLLCLAFLVRLGVLSMERASPNAPDRQMSSDEGNTVWAMLGWVGVVLGWVLLLDMLAWWPVSVYAWGFSTVALATVCVLVTLFWLAWGGNKQATQATILMAAVLVVFAVSRLPSGNIWDALLDPWLWMVLQLVGVQRITRWVRRRFIAQRESPATHV
jgi:hypothetical protein